MADDLRERLARHFHAKACHMPGCDGTPDELDYEDADALLPLVREREAEVLREAAELVRSRRDAFLSSDNLDPAWIAGWHSATDDHAATLAARIARGGGTE